MNEGPGEQWVEALSDLLADLPDPVRLVDRDGRALYRNAAALVFPPEGLGHLCSRERSGGKSSCPACRLDEVFNRGGTQRWHVVRPRSSPPGSRDYFEVTLCPIRDADGRVCCALELLRDETVNFGVQHYLIGDAEQQRRDSERHSDQAQSLSSELGELRDTQTDYLFRDRMSALGELATSLSHEIHTPLGAILSSADLLQRTIGRLAREAGEQTDGVDLRRMTRKLEALETSAEIVGEGARRIHGVLRALRDFARLDESPQKQVDIHEGLESTLKLLQFRMGDRIRVIREYGEIAPLTCRPDALNQVFMNLLLNATQAIPERGEITIHTRSVDGQAVVQIRDSGCGIAEADLERVFDLGFSRRGSSGLGLPLCRKIVEEQGGSIQIESSPGEGTTFTVRLPASDGAAES